MPEAIPETIIATVTRKNNHIISIAIFSNCCVIFSFPLRRAEFGQATSIRRRKNVHKAFI